MQIRNSAAVGYHQSLIDVLRIESEAILQASRQLSQEETQKAIDLILACEGKVVVLGVGKSGIVAHKIAATLASIGTTAVYLHAADAMHGDLGIIDRKDIIMAVSNSGETEEIISLLPHLNLRKVPIISIVGNIQSTLAQQSYAILDASISREACPLNLAPTTSTTVALAVGDALAMTLMQVKQVTAEEFAINHPAGKLGRRLALRVKNLMHSGENNPVIEQHSSWKQVVDAIDQGRLGAVSVVNKEMHLLGIITDGDLRRVMQRTPVEKLSTLTAADMMTKKPVVAHPNMLAYDALQLMEKRSSQISVLPVVLASNQVTGLIRIHDIIGKL
ncbi:KpsF/GutQ family sugar-phosphate isomerase [Rhodocytophaga rosea]|uniref:KpsF/GutQ family sugar-phosphate isomerase n=1 Tax=Rhodocytophaga rosea TaxID=2704465 RepID=A0A6C0GNG5_9BACT|nr:KpsF/GutQ family sugar-phosphate isomerase [Rhodocytophaga rosea]QHT69576.1 KpsF/GutQ family sugar-phosphate isomerase [Rhodocytophaga rosea]